jgi:hypothetical protein
MSMAFFRAASGWLVGLGALLAALTLPFVLACVPQPDPGDAGDAGPTDAPLDTRPVDMGPVRAIFVLPRTGATSGFFDLPWPTDLRLTATGTPDLTGFPNPRFVDLLDQYIQAIEESQVGYSTNGATYFRFSRSVDPTSLPSDPAATRLPSASVFLMDVDPASPERGTLHPCVVEYEDRLTLFWPGETVAIRPVHGFPLAPNRTYAAVVTSGVTPAAGGTYARDADFAALLGTGGDADVVAARALYQPALDTLATEGVDLDQVISLAVFTTEDPTAIGFAIRDWLRDETEPHVVPDAIPADWAPGTGGSGIIEVVGRYGPVPIFQEGVVPYATEGGSISLGPDGEPVVQGTYEARFSISIPAGVPMPPGGFPLVLYSHGTGGDYRSFIADGTASELAMEGYAVMGIDQIHHGERNPTELGPEILFFNLQNPDAVRFNTLESAIDIVQQARAAARFVVPDFITVEGGPVRFDRDQFFFYGHSQGGLVGPLFLGMDDSVRGGVVSAGGAIIAYALLEKEEPLSIPEVVRAVLNLGAGPSARAFAAEGFDFDHPVISLLQGWIDPSDPVNYGAYAIEAPRLDFLPKHILSTEGLRDTYVSPGSIEALALSMRVPLLAPVSRAIPSYELLGLPVMGPSVSLNVAEGRATAGLLQFPEDGHFAVFDNEVGRTRIRGFFASLREGETPTIPGP